MKTMKEFCNESHIDASLIRAAVRQIGGWDEFKNRAHDVASYGAGGGFSGFTYYRDTVDFTKKNKAAIIEHCKQLADDLGESGIIERIRGFNCLKGETQESIADGLYNPRSDNKQTVYNALAWFALEEVSRSYDDLTER